MSADDTATPEVQRFELKDGGWVDFYPGFIPADVADALWAEYTAQDEETREYSGLPWSQDLIGRPEQQILEPRLTCFLGEADGIAYTYSEKRNVSAQWPDSLAAVKTRIEAATTELLAGREYNVVLCNLYRSGLDHIGWHSDNEEDLEKGAPIAALSLGTTRTFQLRHISDSRMGTLQTLARHKRKDGVELTPEEQASLDYEVGADEELNMSLQVKHGDLLVMHGTLQKHWRHRVPRSKKIDDARICFTFRCASAEALQLAGVSSNEGG